MFIRSILSAAVIAALPLSVMADDDFAIFALAGSGAAANSFTGGAATGNASVLNGNRSFAFGGASADATLEEKEVKTVEGGRDGHDGHDGGQYTRGGNSHDAPETTTDTETLTAAVNTNNYALTGSDGYVISTEGRGRGNWAGGFNYGSGQAAGGSVAGAATWDF